MKNSFDTARNIHRWSYNMKIPYGRLKYGRVEKPSKVCQIWYWDLGMTEWVSMILSKIIGLL